MKLKNSNVFYIIFINDIYSGIIIVIYRYNPYDEIIIGSYSMIVSSNNCCLVIVGFDIKWHDIVFLIIGKFLFKKVSKEVQGK